MGFLLLEFRNSWRYFVSTFELYFAYAYFILWLLVSYFLFPSQRFGICQLGAYKALILSRRDGDEFSDDQYTRKGMMFLSFCFCSSLCDDSFELITCARENICGPSILPALCSFADDGKG